ncbi:MAG: sugar MFS transporter [Flavobacteriaceae bacterium]|jgi:FHS family L-fucose permease-like MFS transporter|nr:sugar MFS transporter [Flavobacteriaceae bacterium]
MNNIKSTNYTIPLITLTTLFFMWGFITCLNDILIPFLKGVFSLTHFQANLVQLAFFVAYFIISLIYFIVSATFGDPISKIGYKNTVMAGLIISALACLLFFMEAGSSTPKFGTFLLALFLLGSGFTFLQIAANPLVSLLGKPETASSRLNLSQAFNSLGTTIAPVIGGYFIFKYFVPKEASIAVEAGAVKIPYLFLAGVLLLLAVVIFISKIPNGNVEDSSEKLDKKAGALQYPHLVFGMLGIFFYVGGEVTIGSNLVSYMKEFQGLTENAASSFLAFYWGGAMIGRFMGSISMSDMEGVKKYTLMAVAAIASFILIFTITGISIKEVGYFLIFLVLNYAVFIAARSVPSRTLSYFAGASMILIFIMLISSGTISLWAILGVGLFNSIMFPTIFTLAINGLGKYTSQGSSLLVMMILGGALLPPLQGLIADYTNSHIAFILPLFCYAYLMWYGFVGCNIKKKTNPELSQ